MKRSIVGLIVLLLLSLPLVAGDDERPASTGKLEFKVLWDKSGENPGWHYSWGYSALGKKLIALGGTMLELNPIGEFTDEVLEDIDLVIICERHIDISVPEQKALVRYAREGGGLLVIGEMSASLGVGSPPCNVNDVVTLNPVISNFGMQYTGGYAGSSKVNSFEYPATTKRRPVVHCEVIDPINIDTSNGAIPIAGRDMSSSPAAMDYTFLALGTDSGKGRVIAVGDSTLWKNFGLPSSWFGADNAKLFVNVAEYLLGFSDLSLEKVKCKDDLTAGETAKIKAKVENLETNYNKESKVIFYLSKNKKLETDQDIELGSVAVPSFRGGGTKVVKLDAEIPSDIESGTWFVLAVIDPEDPREINGGNNKKTRKVTVF